MLPPFEVNVDFIGAKALILNKAPLKKVLREGAKKVRQSGRKLAGRKEGSGRSYSVWGGMLHKSSSDGEAPAKLTGAVQRSIFYRVLDRDGLALSIGPKRRGPTFYSWFLAFGTSKMTARPFMAEALRAHQVEINTGLVSAYQQAILPK